jgi:hypothetical protein
MTKFFIVGAGFTPALWHYDVMLLGQPQGIAPTEHERSRFKNH